MAEGGMTPEGLQQQKNQISKLLQKPLKTGDTWYLIDPVWFKQWKRYVGYEKETGHVTQPAAYPGPIDNAPLFKEDGSGEIRDQMLDMVDYELVPEEAWQLFTEWYGTEDGQQPIARKVIESGVFMKQTKVEVYLLELKLCENSNLDRQVSRKFSKEDTIGHLERVMRQIFHVPANRETRVWNRYTTNTYEQLAEREATVSSAGLYPGQIIVLEVQNQDGSWPRRQQSANITNGTADTRSSPAAMMTRYGYGAMSDSHAGAYQPGLCGLANLGNTCFMNSVIQCLSNTPPLCLYFLEGRHLSELNTENPLGMRGEIAKAFGSLVQEMWSGRVQSTVPRAFKYQVSRFAPQFSGYQQHDSQEMLTFILDALHEDLNRVRKKPYIELKDADGRPDKVVAAEAWDNYRKRNNSVVVDMFHGLLKSTVVCPECSKVSVTFDPYCTLQLPLPAKRERNLEVRVVFGDPMRRPMTCKVTVPKQGTIADLCRALERLTQVPHERLVVADVYHNKFHKVFKNKEPLKDISDKDYIYVYECAPPSEDVLNIPVYQRRGESGSGAGGGGGAMVGTPFFVSVPRDQCSYAELLTAVERRLARFVRSGVSTDDWWRPDTAGTSQQSTSLTNGLTTGGSSSDEEDGESESSESPAPYRLQVFTSNSGACAAGQAWQFRPGNSLVLVWSPAAYSALYDTRLEAARDEHESVQARPSKRPAIQLTDCLELFTTTEKLGINDAWYCPDCKKHQEATKKFDLWSLPDILIIHLKRFSYTRIFRDKIDTLVEFPTRGLEMRPHVLDPDHPSATYDLIGVSNHYGGLGGGHYVAYCKSRVDSQWYYFDDSSVTDANEEAVCTKAAYVLFYMRRDPQSAVCRQQQLITNCATVVTNGDDSVEEMDSS